MHIAELFFCHALPDADKACLKTKEILRSPMPGSTNVNQEVILVYVELAHFASLVPGMADKQYATKQYLYDQIQHYNENVLNQTRYNMNGAPLICPRNDILDLILQLSLQAEEHLVPNDYYHRNGKEDIMFLDKINELFKTYFL